MQRDNMKIGDRVTWGYGNIQRGTVTGMNSIRTPPTCVIRADAGVDVVCDMAVCHHIPQPDNICKHCGVNMNPTTGNVLLDMAFETMRQTAYNTYNHHVYDDISKWMHTVVKSYPCMQIRIPLEILHHDQPNMRCNKLLRHPELPQRPTTDDVIAVRAWLRDATMWNDFCHRPSHCGWIHDATTWLRNYT